jgi:hypothetical protein
MTDAERVRLSTLAPEWWADTGYRVGQGISFRCPHCVRHRISVAFDNPIDGGERSTLVKAFHHRSGDDFETLTIRPAIDHSRIGHWHGHVSDGMVHP